MTRRTVLGTVAAGVVLTGCSTGAPQAPTASPTPADPQTAMLRDVIAGKERLVALYQRAALSDATLTGALMPFQQRHLAHLSALREHLKADASPSASPLATATADVSLASLRSAERAAAAARPGQLATATPALSQLIASIGACEALHALALTKVGEPS